MTTKEASSIGGAGLCAFISFCSFFYAAVLVTGKSLAWERATIWATGLISTLLFCFFLYIATNSYSRTNPGEDSTCNSATTNRLFSISRWGIVVIALSAVIFYSSFTFILSLTWLSGDDFGFGPFPGHGYSLIGALKTAAGRYISWVSRPGDVIASVFRISTNRWQEIYITPFFITVLPFFAIRLYRLPLKFAATSQGILFFWFCCFLCLSAGGMHEHTWRIFWCYAASCNYLWPTVTMAFFLSFYTNNNQQKQTSTIAAIFIFLCGIYCGWGLECITPFLIIFLTIWCIYRLTKGLYISQSCRIGYFGSIIGSYLLFCSPALHIRQLRLARSRIFDPLCHTSEETTNFITNITQEQLFFLRGNFGHEVVSLSDIPLFMHAHFIPYISKSFWNYSAPVWYATVAIILFCIISRFLSKKTAFPSVKLIIVSIGVYLTAIVCLYLYLLGCIPASYAFWPPTFIVCMMTGYIFLILSKKHFSFSFIITLGVATYALWNIIPAVKEAYAYKEYNQRWISQVSQQKNMGKEDIIIDYLLPNRPNDTLKLFYLDRGLKESADETANQWAKDCFSVKSISVRKLFLNNSQNNSD